MLCLWISFKFVNDTTIKGWFEELNKGAWAHHGAHAFTCCSASTAGTAFKAHRSFLGNKTWKHTTTCEPNSPVKAVNNSWLCIRATSGAPQVVGSPSKPNTPPPPPSLLYTHPSSDLCCKSPRPILTPGGVDRSVGDEREIKQQLLWLWRMQQSGLESLALDWSNSHLLTTDLPLH